MANEFTARVAGISVELGMSVQNKSGIWCKPTVRMELMIDGGTNPQQRELAKVLEVPPTTVNGWMRGAHLPDIEKLMEICDYLEMPVGEMLGDHRHINDLDEVKHLMDVSLKQKAYIENLEAELNECKMLNNQLMSDLDADEGLAEICVNEFIADTIKAVKDAGVKKITVEF